MQKIDGDMIEDESGADSALQAELQRRLFVQPGHLIRRLHQISTAIFLRESSKYDLTQLQYVALVMVDTFPGIDQGRLGRAAALDRQTISTVVKRLVEKGLLLRKRKDRRTTALYVTGAGRALHQVMASRLGIVGETLLSPLTEDEQTTFFALMTKMVTELNELSRSPQSQVDGPNETGRAEKAARSPRRRPTTKPEQDGAA